MVSFQCDGCADTIKKPKLDQHRQRCWASFTCLDCSKTFQNQEYRTHTSCISEQEKYQGALYKGPRKGKEGDVPVVSTPISTATSASLPLGTATIHPSRLPQMDSDPAQQNPQYSTTRAEPSGRGGTARGRFNRAGKLYGATASGQNSVSLQAGMRSWGSPAIADSPSSNGRATESTETVTSAAQGEEKKKKKKKKGDKGGTGSKANSKLGKTTVPEVTSFDNAKSDIKKRKRDASTPSHTDSSELSNKTIKKLRKNAGKLAETAKHGISLAEWLSQIGQGKKETVEATDASRALTVSFADGKWVLSI